MSSTFLYTLTKKVGIYNNLNYINEIPKYDVINDVINFVSQSATDPKILSANDQEIISNNTIVFFDEMSQLTDEETLFVFIYCGLNIKQTSIFVLPDLTRQYIDLI